MKHTLGDKNCTACREAFPTACDCGSLIHADKDIAVTVAMCEICNFKTVIGRSQCQQA